ncbi:hypothetical protein D046_8243A, partial [Vibrio parahaemolyticus V-223/04]|jgi:aldehyde dehydrogenase (NAD+)
MTET